MNALKKFLFLILKKLLLLRLKKYLIKKLIVLVISAICKCVDIVINLNKVIK
jgi:hypothetical protein